MNTMRLIPAVLLLALAGCGTAPPKPGGEGAAVTCRRTDEREIAGLFDRWNTSLQTGNAAKVVDNYAERSILLPTLSGKPRITRQEKLDYFEKEFLPKRPKGEIDFRFIVIGCNAAVDAGNYTFTLQTSGEKVPARYTYTYAWNGREWLITSHHSSLVPKG